MAQVSPMTITAEQLEQMLLGYFYKNCQPEIIGEYSDGELSYDGVIQLKELAAILSEKLGETMEEKPKKIFVANNKVLENRISQKANKRETAHLKRRLDYYAKKLRVIEEKMAEIEALRSENLSLMAQIIYQTVQRDGPRQNALHSK